MNVEGVLQGTCAWRRISFALGSKSEILRASQVGLLNGDPNNFCVQDSELLHIHLACSALLNSVHQSEHASSRVDFLE
jgi:hypothetical protein